VTIDNKILGTIAGVILTAIIGQILYMIRKDKKENKDAIFGKLRDLVTSIQKLDDNQRELKDMVIQGFGDIKLYMATHYTNKTDCKSNEERHDKTHEEIFKRLNKEPT
jgi:hypothetical protein